MINSQHPNFRSKLNLFAMEKYEPSNRVSSEMAPGPDVVGEVVQMDWTPKEETKTVRKYVLLPFSLR